MIHLSSGIKRSLPQLVSGFPIIQQACCPFLCAFPTSLFLSARMETSQDLRSLLFPTTITQTSLPIISSGAQGRRHACRREHLSKVAGYSILRSKTDSTRLLWRTHGSVMLPRGLFFAFTPCVVSKELVYTDDVAVACFSQGIEEP